MEHPMTHVEAIVQIIGHVAWPITFLATAFFARKEILKIAAALAKRVEDRNSDISITKEGIAIKQAVEAQQAKIDSLKAEQAQVKSIALQNVITTDTIQTNGNTIDQHLQDMADRYMNINIPDYTNRVRAKDKAAEEMALYIITKKISKDEISKHQHDGLIVGLADSILLVPESDDIERLLKAGVHVQRLHVKFRVLVALTKLFESGFGSEKQIDSTFDLLKTYSDKADPPLQRVINNTRSYLGQIRAQRKAKS
jgi:hypothetical protein